MDPPFKDSSLCVTSECAGIVAVPQRVIEKVKELPDDLVVDHGESWLLTEFETDVEGHQPIRLNPRRYSSELLEYAREAVDKLLEIVEKEVIEPCNSARCFSPVHTPKPDGNYRFCVDFRKLNDFTRKVGHPIPNIDSILENQEGKSHI